jgi:hypothetical protein
MAAYTTPAAMIGRSWAGFAHDGWGPWKEKLPTPIATSTAAATHAGGARHRTAQHSTTSPAAT